MEHVKLYTDELAKFRDPILDLENFPIVDESKAKAASEEDGDDQAKAAFRIHDLLQGGYNIELDNN